MRLRSTALAALAVLSLTAAAGCGEDEPEPTAAGTATATTETTPTTPAETAPAEAAPSEESAGTAAGGADISTDLETKPEIPARQGEPPSELQTNDIVEGDGPAAKAGDTVSVRYVGGFYESGEQFDASWDREPDTFEFTLGAGEVIPGWDQGVEGMRVGGRRELIIPSELAYGPEGQGPIPPDATLTFVVDLVDIQ